MKSTGRSPNDRSTRVAELSEMYRELANPTQYAADFNDITQGASQCGKGFDQCTGIGSPTPAACDTTMLRWSVVRSVGSMRMLANRPNPVLMP